MGPVHCSRDPQTSFLSNFFIKNGSHDTIHIFKNYFIIVFSVSRKISCIQTDYMYIFPLVLVCNDNKVHHTLMFKPDQPTRNQSPCMNFFFLISGSLSCLLFQCETQPVYFVARVSLSPTVSSFPSTPVFNSTLIANPFDYKCTRFP